MYPSLDDDRIMQLVVMEGRYGGYNVFHGTRSGMAGLAMVWRK